MVIVGILVLLAVLPALVGIYDPPLKGSMLELFAVIVLGCAGIAAPGTVLGLITSQARGSSVMLPLLMFPLVVPALLAASSATSRLFEGDPMGQAPSWILLLVIFNAVHWSVSAVLYGRIFED